MCRLLPVNPARAGMIPAESHGHRNANGKPRASGDDPAGDLDDKASPG